MSGPWNPGSGLIRLFVLLRFIHSFLLSELRRTAAQMLSSEIQNGPWTASKEGGGESPNVIEKAMVEKPWSTSVY